MSTPSTKLSGREVVTTMKSSKDTAKGDEPLTQDQDTTWVSADLLKLEDEEIWLSDVNTIIDVMEKAFQEHDSRVKKHNCDGPGSCVTKSLDELVSYKLIKQSLRERVGDHILASIAYSYFHMHVPETDEPLEDREIRLLEVFKEQFILTLPNHAKVPYNTFCLAYASIPSPPHVFSHSARQSTGRPKISPDDAQKDRKFRMAMAYPSVSVHDPAIKSLSQTNSVVQCGEYKSLSFLANWAKKHLKQPGNEGCSISISSLAITGRKNIPQIFCGNCVYYVCDTVMGTKGLRIVDNAAQRLSVTPSVFQSRYTMDHWSSEDSSDQYVTDEEFESLKARWAKVGVVSGNKEAVEEAHEENRKEESKRGSRK